jgi:copper chaperone
MSETTYTVEGMSCEHCVNAVTSEVSGVEGVSSVAVDLESRSVTVAGDGFDDRAVCAAIDEAGYEVVEA